MKRFRSIAYYVRPTEDNTSALSRVFNLARSTGSSVKLIGVFEPVSALVKRLVPATVDVDALSLESLRSRLEMLASGKDAEGVEVTTALRRGRPFVQVIREVIEHDHDLVVKSGGGAADGPLLESTALHLMRKCPVPVWVLDPDRPTFKRVVCAVDVADEASKAMHRKVIELAMSLAHTHGAELEVVHAWDVPSEHLLRSRVSPEELEALLTKTRETAQERVAELVAEAGATDAKQVMVRGYHADALSQHLRKNDADLIVLGTLSRTGVAGVFIGSTAERVLKSVHCSVLAVKPEGFASPVTVE